MPGQEYGILNVQIPSRPGADPVVVKTCHGCGGLVADTGIHDAFHERVGDEFTGESHGEKVSRAKFGVRVTPRPGVQIGDGNTQHNSFPGGRQ